MRNDNDSARGPSFWLCAQLIQACIVGKATFTSVASALRRSKTHQPHCQDCGWAVAGDAANLVCGPCGRLRASKIKLFCCDVDLTFVNGWSRVRPEWQRTITNRYHCSACGRIWLYVIEWHKDSGCEADWYPQWTEADGDDPPDLFDERTRTKVYRW